VDDQAPEPQPEPAPGTVAAACLAFIRSRQVYPSFPLSGGQVPRVAPATPPAAPAAPATPPTEWRDLGAIHAARLAAQGGGIRGGPKK
jgi:hypothetical protein